MFLLKRLLCISILIIPLTVLSQDIIFCKGLDYFGWPVNETNEFNFSSGSGYVYYLVKSPTNFQQTNYLLKIEKEQKTGTDTFCKTQLLTADTTQNSATTDLYFTESGKYTVCLFNGNQTLKCSLINISLNNEDNPESTNYFIDSKIIFCERVDSNGNAINISDTFALKGRKGYVAALLTNKNKPFKNDTLIISSYKNDGGDYTLFAGETNYPIKPEATDVRFTFWFKKRGTYRISVFTPDDVFVADGFVTLK